MSGQLRRAAPIGLAALALCCVAGGGASAQEALYGKQAPPGSAFIRFVSTLPEAAAVSTNTRVGARLGTSADERVAAYTVIENAAAHPLSVAVKEGDRTGQFTYQPAADSYVTLVLQQDAAGTIKMVPVVDQAEFNQTRVRLAFYNLEPGCPSATLALDPGGQAVFAEVASGATKSRSVNPVHATVKVDCSTAGSPTLVLNGMDVGASYSIWLAKAGPTTTLALTKDASARYDPKS